MKDTAVLVPDAASSTAPRLMDRLESVDLVRGFVMMLMALDHTRDFFHAGAVHGFDPLDLKHTHFALFVTRWITHFCAPIFIFLAGTGAFLATTRGRSRRELSWFLLTRGGWLVLLELTFVHSLGWTFSFDLHNRAALVIWTIGWSMIALAGLVHLPVWAVTTFGLVMIAGHNALDGVKAESWGALGWLWKILHARGAIEYAPGYFLRVGYPLIPWIGVMAAGYGFGQLLTRPRNERRRLTLGLGVAVTLAFVVVRLTNLYGDPRPWTTQSTPMLTVFSFLHCAKYPPSLCYLLMTLGPALLLLGLLDRDAPTPRTLRPALVFGRVPMFYYLLHLPLIHGLAVIHETLRFGSASWLFGDPFGPHAKAVAGAGVHLWTVYLIWLLILGLLYPVCRWFADLKRRRRDAWLSYL